MIGDKKVKLVFDDGRHFVRTTQEKYDVITSDPIDPWVKGCRALEHGRILPDVQGQSERRRRDDAVDSAL